MTTSKAFQKMSPIQKREFKFDKLPKRWRQFLRENSPKNLVSSTHYLEFLPNFFTICAFSFNRFEFFWEFLQENSYISASDGQILVQRPDLDRLLNSNIMLQDQIQIKKRNIHQKWHRSQKRLKKLCNILMLILKIVKFLNFWQISD